MFAKPFPRWLPGCPARAWGLGNRRFFKETCNKGCLTQFVLGLVEIQAMIVTVVLYLIEGWVVNSIQVELSVDLLSELL